MFKFVLELLLTTPWWVYLILFVLVKLGLGATKSRIISYKRIIIAPIILMQMSLYPLGRVVSGDAGVILIVVSSALLGILIGWCLVNHQQVVIDRQHMLFRMPGAWDTLVIMLVVFSCRYYFEYKMAINPNVISDSFFRNEVAILTGVCCGFFTGKILCFTQRLITQKSVNLV